jgi:hypothetical protein
MSWSVLSTTTEEASPAQARASIKVDWESQGTRKVTQLQGNVSLLQDDGPFQSKRFKFTVDAVRVDGVATTTGPLLCTILLPDGKWEILQPAIKFSQHGNHVAYVIHMSFDVHNSHNNGLHSIRLLIPLPAASSDEMAKLFFAAIMYANQVHHGG